MSEPAADPNVELRAALDDLRRELGELRDASTAAEKTAAKVDVVEAEEDVKEAAKRAGLKPEQYRNALAAAKREAFLEEYGAEIDARVEAKVNAEIDRILAEAETAADNDAKIGKASPKGEKEKAAASKGTGDARSVRDTQKSAAPPESQGPPPDSSPDRPHWSEQKLSELVR